MSELQAMLERESELANELVKVRASIHALRCEQAGVKAGDIVRGQKGELGRVVAVKHWGDGRPWVEVNQQKKDGSFGAIRRHWYDRWELVADAS